MSAASNHRPVGRRTRYSSTISCLLPPGQPGEGARALSPFDYSETTGSRRR
jgi:hypothetical protein